MRSYCIFSFSVGLIPPRVISGRFIHVVTNGRRAGLLCAQIGDILPCRPTASLLLASLMSPDVTGEERRTESGPGSSGNQPQGYPKSLVVSALVNSHLRDLLPTFPRADPAFCSNEGALHFPFTSPTESFADT